MLKPTLKQTGTTTSEKFLSTICERAFFGLWSYPNLYIDHVHNGGATTSKELCDLFLVFDNEVVIFSDKKIEYRATADIKVGWTRWYKKAIKESVNQIYGAERWIKTNPDRIFYDKECRNRFGLEFPDAKELKVHRVAITSDMSKTCQQYYGGGSSGTFILTPKIEGDAHFDFPFQLGNVNPQKGYVHLFNELSISMVLSELDTVGDFIDYLRKREIFLTSGIVVSVAGEEELLGYYFANHYDYEDSIATLVENSKELKDFGIALMEGDWSQHFDSHEYQYVKQVRKQSYLWDALIKNFDEAILAGKVPEWADDHVCMHERALRMLARERRAFRQILARNLYEKVSAVKSNERSARIIISPSYPDSCYVLLCYGREASEDYEEYRTTRRNYLNGYCHVVKSTNPQIRYVTGIATEQADADGRSEDLIVFDFEGWTEADNNQAKMMQEELSILKTVRNNDKNLKNNLLREMFPWIVTDSKKNKSKVGRNDPCICGSGKKYKKCCL